MKADCACEREHREWLIGLAVTRQNPYMVIETVPGEYVKTFRWEINPDNGYVTAQLKDGSILPTRFGHWAPADLVLDILGISQEDVSPDVP